MMSEHFEVKISSNLPKNNSAWFKYTIYSYQDNKGLCIILGRALEPLLSLNYFLVVLELDLLSWSRTIFSEFCDDINGLG